MTSAAFHPDQRFIDALLINERQIIDEIYYRFSAKIKVFVMKNGGSREDAAAIFQETLLDICQQAKYKNFKIAGRFEPLLLLLCKRKWLRAMKENLPPATTIQGEPLFSDAEETLAADVEALEKGQAEAKTYLLVINQLEQKCRKIIGTASGGEAQEKLAIRLGITRSYFRKKKSECMASLIKTTKKMVNDTADRIAGYIEGAMEEREKAHFEDMLATDPALRKEMEDYYQFRSSLKMGLERENDEERLKETLETLARQYFAKQPTIISFKKLLKRLSPKRK